MKNRVSVVIPNFNGEKLLSANLPKVISAVDKAEIIVVDDASTDNSLKVLEKFLPRVKVVKRKQNSGFASAVNSGVKSTSGEYILLLNSDVYPEQNFLSFLLPYFKDDKVFAVGCLQYGFRWKGNNVHGRGVGKFHQGFLYHGPGDVKNKNTLWVFGGAGIYRKKLWQELGGMDTLYDPFYWEDIDLSYRALKAGYKLVFEPKSIVYHQHQQGAIRNTYLPDEIKTIAYRNQILFVWLNITDIIMMIQHLIYLPIQLIKAFIKSDWSFVKGYIAAVILFPKVIIHRGRNSIKSVISDRIILQNLAK